jgi:methyl-accepting chemotaxis protein
VAVNRLAELPVRTAIRGFAVLLSAALALSGWQVLSAIGSTDDHLGRMEASLVQINGAVDRMNASQEGLERIDVSLGTLGATTDTIGKGVAESRSRIGGLSDATSRIASLVGQVDSSTRSITAQLAVVSTRTATLARSVDALGTTVTPLVSSTASVRASVAGMGKGIAGMNGSLRYVIRVLNYLAAPPGGGGFSVRVNLDPRSLPDLAGVIVRTDPVPVFTRNRWKPYTGR